MRDDARDDAADGGVPADRPGSESAGAGHAPECGEYGFCDGRCRREACEGCGDFGLCDGRCRLAWCEGGCSGHGYCDGTCERRRETGSGGAGSAPRDRAVLNLVGERGAELAAGIRSFADLTTDEVRAWARAEGADGSGGSGGSGGSEGSDGSDAAQSDSASEGRRGSAGEQAGARRGTCPDPGPLVVVEARSAEFAGVWPARGGGLEPRPGLLTSVVRAGSVMIYPPPLFDPRVAAARRTGVWPVPDEPRPAESADPAPGSDPEPKRGPAAVAVAVSSAMPAVPEPGVLAAEARRPMDPASQQAYTEIRQLVGVLVEVMAGRRSAQQVALWVHARVREALRDPVASRYGGTAVLRRVRLSAVAAPDTGVAGVEALALVQDGTRMRAAAFRFDAVADPGRGTAGTTRWQCTALQTA